LIQAILIQATQGAATEPTKASKGTGQVEGDFAAMLQAVAQAKPAAAGVDTTIDSAVPKSDPLAQAAADLAAALTGAITPENPELQEENEAAENKAPEETPADALASSMEAMEAMTAGLPAPVTPVQNTAPQTQVADAEPVSLEAGIPAGNNRVQTAALSLEQSGEPLQAADGQAPNAQSATPASSTEAAAQTTQAAETVEMNGDTLQNAVRKAQAANVAAASLTATQEARPEKISQPNQRAAAVLEEATPPAVTAGRGSDAAPTAADQQKPAVGTATVPAEKAMMEKSTHQRQVASVSPHSTADTYADALLRADLNNAAPATSGAPATNATNATALPENQALVRQSLLDQTRQGIEASLQNGKTMLRIHLSPEDLGGIDLRVIAGPHGASVMIRADNPATGRMLEQNLSDLRTALQDAGVQLNNLSVGQQGAQNGQFNGQNAPSQHGLPGAFHRQTANSAAAKAEDTVQSVVRSQNGAPTQVNYLV